MINRGLHGQTNKAFGYGVGGRWFKPCKKQCSRAEDNERLLVIFLRVYWEKWYSKPSMPFVHSTVLTISNLQVSEDIFHRNLFKA